MHFDVKKIARDFLPNTLHSAAISIYNTMLYMQRHGGRYAEWFEYYKKWELSSPEDWMHEQRRRLSEFILYAKENSQFYKDKLQHIRECSIEDLKKLPILEKEDLRQNLEKIRTVSKMKAVISYTGGTTGASLKVYYHPEDMQERFAILDFFRGKYGYRLGERVAWFSGKELLSERDVKNNHFYKDDYINKIRFFSTFHISEKTFDSYWESINDFKPKYIVGFPSSVYDLCHFAHKRGRGIEHPVNTFFPTAEALIPEQIQLINSVLGCRSVNQYASSEGAPFILECEYGNLHIHPLTGIFEILDENMNDAISGELIVTSFSTRGTPLIRYRVGDRVTLKGNSSCQCGCTFPMVESIDGRVNDFIFSPYTGKCNLGNLSNCTKHVKGISCFQVLQNEVDSIDVRVVGDVEFTEQERIKFKEALHERLGQEMKINLLCVDSIPREKSGKFRIVKNNLPKSILENK